ncbi:protein-tyrosine phosphatase family protein [Candidatus Nitrosocosmicus agrestis]|jgi:hypothetical protein|uniref:protein-tyrosine phosphatase family protein n=1 Tax=Candidatus Nitrosocosmicus agrestis TaxID=2563600 RepID=UPI00122E73BD|nr:dual specificity protein phosphatase family protein [Candidatus Nitrosocosmicus sp. SS]KAA2282977.1 dual specificity protein phosphatase family protein [Candidatus Nitrosocosmicus sp. SS]KAF0869180.1 dual specificity protein phosphatase family protein [Candidatus Nitrosocosmicus sp. SS]
MNKVYEINSNILLLANIAIVIPLKLERIDGLISNYYNKQCRDLQMTISIIIPDKLSTAGMGEYHYSFLQEGLYQPDQDSPESWRVVSVRHLVDDDSNSLQEYEKCIDTAIATINQHGKVVICCSYGISRSNAIAVGVLVKHFGMDFDNAVELVKKMVSKANIKNAHIIKLKELFGINNSKTFVST